MVSELIIFTGDPGDSENWDLVRLLQDITHSHAAEYSNYTEAQFNALVNFHQNQLFDCSIKARFYARRGLASQAIIDNARKAFRMKQPLNVDDDSNPREEVVVVPSYTPYTRPLMMPPRGDPQGDREQLARLDPSLPPHSAP